MSSKREQVLLAVMAMIQAAKPLAKIQRNGLKPQAQDPAGNIVIRDGTPELESEELSPRTWLWSHAIPLEIAVPPGVSLDDYLVDIGNAVAADPTLGGAVDLLEPDAPDDGDLDVEGAAPGRWANVALIAHYPTTNPLT